MTSPSQPIANPVEVVAQTLAFFASVIQCREPWTETTSKEYKRAKDALDQLRAATTLEVDALMEFATHFTNCAWCRSMFPEGCAVGMALKSKLSLTDSVHGPTESPKV